MRRGFNLIKACFQNFSRRWGYSFFIISIETHLVNSTKEARVRDIKKRGLHNISIIGCQHTLELPVSRFLWVHIYYILSDQF